MKEEEVNPKKASKTTSKSTAIGHLLYLTQHASKDGMDTIHKPFYWKEKVFLPTKRRVVVLNAAHGKVEQILDIHMDNDDDDDDSTSIECACVVVETAKDVLILASLSNATVVEWLVGAAIKDEETSTKQLLPRRIFQLGPDFYQDKDQSNSLSNRHSRFLHFVSPLQNNSNLDTIIKESNHFIIYAVLQPFSSTEHKKMKLVEIHIPTFRLEKKRRPALNIPTFRIIIDSIPSCDEDVNFPQSLHCFDCTMMNNLNNNTNNSFEQRSAARITRRMLAIVTKSTILLCYDNNNDTTNDKQQEMSTKRDYRFVSYTPVSNHYNTSSKPKDVQRPPTSRHARNKNDIFISCVAFNTATSVGDELRADLAIGYSNGKINVLYNFLDAIPQLFDTLSFTNTSTTSDSNNKKKKQKHKKVKHLSKGTAMKVTTKDLLSLSSSSQLNIIIKTFHWHVHPVLTMIFFSPTLLMSAGEEAVVVTWSLFAQQSDATMNKPSHTLPRVTKGDILLLLAAKETNNGILVVGRDNTLQWISIPEYRSKWQIQGIASVSGEHSSHACTVQDDSTNCCNAVLMKLDPRMAIPVCANLPGAPGFLQWYSNGTEEDLLSRVQMQLQVAAFNRVSRTDRNGPATVVPSRVSHFAFSADGTTLLTVDTSVLQLTAIGREVHLEDDHNTNSSTWNQVTTLKFWSSSAPNDNNKSNSPYHMNALIMHPHGRSASVAGLVLSNNGIVGVTSSVQENCFRVWKRHDSSGRYAGSTNSILWRCVFQFQTPAGIYPPSGPMAFSPDDSLLAVANGNVVTIWDYEQSTLLRSIGSFLGNIVKELYIDETGRIVVSGNTKLECHSIFPRKTISQPNSTKVWEWCDNNCSTTKARRSEEEQEDNKLSMSPANTITSCFLAAFQEFAIAVSWHYLDREDSEIKNGSITHVYFIDAITGIQKSSKEHLYTITGAVHSMCSCGELVFLWMSTSELIKINSRGSLSLPSMFTPPISLQNEVQDDARSHAPALFDLLGDSKDVKQKRLHHVVVSSTIEDHKPKKRPTLVEGFGIGNVSNSELPLLSGSFIRDFVCQRLQVLED